MDSGVTADTLQWMSVQPMSNLTDTAIMNKITNVRFGVGQINSSVLFNLVRHYHENRGPPGVARTTHREVLMRVALEHGTHLYPSKWESGPKFLQWRHGPMHFRTL